MCLIIEPSFCTWGILSISDKINFKIIRLWSIVLDVEVSEIWLISTIITQLISRRQAWEEAHQRRIQKWIIGSQLYGLLYFIFLMSIFKQLSSKINHVYLKVEKSILKSQWQNGIYVLKLYIVICTYFLKIACCLLHIESHWVWK